MEQATINLLQYGALGATCAILFGLVFYLIKVIIKINEINNEAHKKINEANNITHKEVGDKLDRMGDKLSASIERALIESNRK